MIRQRKSSIPEWIVFLVPSICAVVASGTVGLDHMWRDGIVYTVFLFAAIVSALRPAWRRKSFWTTLALIFAGHAILLLATLQALPPRQHGIPKLLLLPIGAVEGAFIVAILWKRMKVLRTSGAQS